MEGRPASRPPVLGSTPRAAGPPRLWAGASGAMTEDQRTYADRRCRYLVADATFAGAFVDWARDVMNTAYGDRPETTRTVDLRVQSKRWIVERPFSWITAHRRLARGYERKPANAENFIHLAMNRMMVRRLAWEASSPI